MQFKRPFYMGVSEVANGQFRKFKADHRSGIIGQNTLDLDNQPVDGRDLAGRGAVLQLAVATGQAAAGVREQGRPHGRRAADDDRLSVAHRRRVGMGGALRRVAASCRRYPWGDTLPVTPRSGNYADVTARLIVQDVIPDYDDGYAAAAPTGKFPANSLGLFDVGGNVAEWVHDYYTVSSDSGAVAVGSHGSGRRQAAARDPRRQLEAIERYRDLRLSARDFGESQRNDVGFRVARYAE